MAATNGTTDQIPVIDLSGPEGTVAKELVNAATTCGFVYIKSLGKDIPLESIDGTFALSKKFFSSPIEEKEPFKIKEDNRGWVAFHAETLDPKTMGDFKEAMNLGGFLDRKAQQPLPPVFKDHEPELYAFQRYCQNLMNKILDLFAIGLEVSSPTEGSKWFSNRHGPEPTPCTLRLLHYPPLPPNTELQPKVDIRAGAHSDYGSITLLFQRPGQPGLEILPPSRSSSSNTENWTPVPVFPPGTESDPSPPILVNIGDLLSHWTNNLFKSTVHRVVFPGGGKEAGKDRYSIAYFGHPIGDTVLEPVPSEKVKALAGKGGSDVQAMTAHEHLLSRLKATYLGMYKDEGKGTAEVGAT